MPAFAEFLDHPILKRWNVIGLRLVTLERIVNRRPSLLDDQAPQNPQTLNRGRASLCRRDFKSFDLLFDFVDETSGTGAVVYSMVESE